MQDVALVLQVPQHAHPGMHALVVPALGVHRVGAEDLQLAGIDFRRQRPDHAPVFILEKPAHGSGKHQQGRARVSEDQHFHVAMQFVAVALVIFAVHDGETVSGNGARYLT